MVMKVEAVTVKRLLLIPKSASSVDSAVVAASNYMYFICEEIK